MTETHSTYDVAPNRCHCDADWEIEQVTADEAMIICENCRQWIMDFEAVARWNAQRAKIERLRSELAESQRQAEGYAEAVVDYEQQVHELQAELRTTTQENERLRLWAAAWKAAAKVERSRSQYWYDEWKYTSQQWAKEPSALLGWAKEYMTRAEEAERKLEQERKLAELRSRPYRQSDGTQETDGTTRSR